ncbi:MAG: glycosyltransferase family 39 protein [Acidobacteria bacterium]|nr:glycosyltransferase family 39 protein [Acidobacteriota bacterium]
MSSLIRSHGMRLLVAGTWLACGAYAARFVDRGWVPHDEGTIGQSAMRVLAHEVPHRDFDDMYTGGLTYLNAAAMAVFGENLRAPRLVLLAVFMAFLAAVYAIGRRVAPAGAALVLMILCAVWTVPNYFVSLPSWYNLFFATFGTLAFMKYFDTRRRRWLAVAGALGGCSVLMKISGVFYLAGGLLALAATAREDGPPGRHASPRVLVSVLAGLVMLAQAALVANHQLTPALLQILLPATAVVLFHAWTEWRAGGPDLRARAARFHADAWPFVAGAVVPMALFAAWFAAHGALADLLRGVFILPQRRLSEAAADPPGAATLVLGIPCLAMILAGATRRVPYAGGLAALAAAALGWLLRDADHPVIYSAVWSLVRTLPLVAVVACAWVLSTPSWRAERDAPSRAHVHLLMSLAATVSLIQLPYATGIYFCYGVPLSFLALLAVARTRTWAPRSIHAVSAAFLIGFAMLYMNTAYVWALGRRYEPYAVSADLGPRASLRVRPAEAALYRQLIEAIQAHAPAGSTIWAGPDCPEVYFLGGYVNPTRAFFDFLTPAPLTAERMESMLARSAIQAAVLNTTPLFSPPVDPAIVAVLRRHFPEVQRVGPFEVFGTGLSP